MKPASWLRNNFTTWFLAFASIFYVLLRFPSIFEPYWYGDEGVYQAVGMLLKSGASLYSGAWDNKPPLLLAFYSLFNSDQFMLRTISLVFGLLSVWLFYFISKKLFKENKLAISLATVLFAFGFGSMIIEGNIANTENLIILPILAGAYLVLSGNKIKKSREFSTFLLAGFLFSIAFLSKIVAAFDFLAMFLFISIYSLSELKTALKNKMIPFLLGFGIPVLLTIAYFLITNNFKDFMDAFLLSNVGYVGKENAFIIPQGFLIFKSTLLGLYLLFIYKKRESINKNLMFILIWFGLGLFSAFFSQRPYTHYLIMFLPSFCLLAGAIITNRKERYYLLGLLLLSYIFINNSFKLNTEISAYYKNYISYATGAKDLESYQAFFDRNTPRDYLLASYIKANTTESERIFIWGNNPQLYKLSNKTPLLRYTAAYHITGFPEGLRDMTMALEKFQPKFIIIMPNANEPYPLPLNNYNEKINIRGAIIYEKIL